MYHVSAQGVDERMINVHYYYSTSLSPLAQIELTCSLLTLLTPEEDKEMNLPMLADLGRVLLSTKR